MMDNPDSNDVVEGVIAETMLETDTQREVVDQANKPWADTTALEGKSDVPHSLVGWVCSLFLTVGFSVIESMSIDPIGPMADVAHLNGTV